MTYAISHFLRDTVTEICLSLFQTNLGINYMHHTRCYTDGSYFTLSTCPKLNEYFAQNHSHRNEELFLNQHSTFPLTYFPNSLIPEPHKSAIYKDTLRIAGFKYGFHFVEANTEYIDVFCFGSKDNNDIERFALENQKLFLNFIQFYKNEAKKIIEKASQHKISLQNIKSQTNTHKLNNDYQASDDLPFKDYALSKFNLTPRELECAMLLSSTSSCKKIAKKLGISHRTAEKHLDKLRSKLGAQTLSQVIYVLMKNKIIN